MALTTKSAWALMDGATPPQEVRMKVQAITKFWYEGKLIVPPAILEIPELLVAELVNAHKAVMAPTQEESHGPVITSESQSVEDV